MRFIQLVLVAALAACAAASEPKRLIALSEDNQVWMDEAQIQKLTVARIGFMDITDFVNLPKIGAAPTPDPLPNQVKQKAYVDMLLPSVSTNFLISYITSLSNYNTRYYKSTTGADAAVWIQGQFKNIATQYSRTDVTVELFAHSFVQSSVIATIPGIGPNKNQVVIIGGHEDSIVMSNPATGRSPGADDDASGTASVLEAFRVLLGTGYTPDRTVKFMTYAGEEAGLLGSQAIATSFLQKSTNVYGVMQMDMTGYGDGPLGIITDYTSQDLNAFLRLLIETYSSLEWVDTKCGYGCSDHASWNKTGYRSCIPFETDFGDDNPYIHTANDVLAKISPARMAEVVKVGLGFLVELAGRAEM